MATTTTLQFEITTPLDRARLAHSRATASGSSEWHAVHATTKTTAAASHSSTAAAGTTPSTTTTVPDQVNTQVRTPPQCRLRKGLGDEDVPGSQEVLLGNVGNGFQAEVRQRAGREMRRMTGSRTRAGNRAWR